jgi:hypothetical protein
MGPYPTCKQRDQFSNAGISQRFAPLKIFCKIFGNAGIKRAHLTAPDIVLRVYLSRMEDANVTAMLAKCRLDDFMAKHADEIELMKLELVKYHAKKFWTHVDVTGDINECWRFKGSKSTSKDHAKKRFGYLALQVNMPAHRVAYYLRYEHLPEVVRHICDNGVCCNPYHLLPGNHADNNEDKSLRRRCKNGSTKLTETQVNEILRSSDSAKTLALRYDVTLTSIRSIKRGKTWKRLKQCGS